MSARSVKLLTVERGNKPGVFATITDHLGARDINILGFTGYVEDPETDCVISFFVDKPEEAIDTMENLEVEVKVQEAVAYRTPHQPGEASRITAPLRKNKIDIRKTFPFVGPDKQEVGIVFQTADHQTTQQLLNQLPAGRDE